MNRYVLLLCTMLLAWSASAQIKGKVVEVSAANDTTPLPSAIVTWYKTTLATTTNNNGEFSISKPISSNTLIISYVGFKSDTIMVNDSVADLLIVLSDAVNLQEVEVAYKTSGTELSYMNPIKVETLNERSLMKAACCNLSESFETNPSIDVNFADAVSGTKQIQMLGLSGQYALITKENMPYLRGLSNGYGLTFIPGPWIQSIQLSKGAGSVINGYESLTGQINTELQHPDNSDRLYFNMYGNQNARNEYNLNASHRFNDKVSTGILSHISFNPLAEDMNHDGFADIPTGRQYNIINKYEIQTRKGIEMQFGGGYLKDERNGGQFKSLVPHLSDTSQLYKIAINNEKWELYTKTGYVFKNKPSTSMGLQLSYTNQSQDNRYGLNFYKGQQATFYANYIFQSIIKTTNHSYKTGLSFISDGFKETFKTFSFQRQEQTIGGFLEYAYNYSDHLNIVAGIRADYHNYYGLFYTPRLHLRYALNENKTVLRASIGKALKTANILAENTFLMASSREWELQSSNLNKPYGLNEEIGWNYGVNFTHKFSLNYRDAYITVDAYQTRFQNQAIIDVDNNTQKVVIYNLNGVSYSNTIQTEFGWEIRKRLTSKIAYRYVDAKTTYSTNLLEKPLVSKHRGFINLAYETKNQHWQFDFTTQFIGSKRLPTTSTNPIVYQQLSYSPNYLNLMGQITYLTKLKRNDLHLYIGCENISDYKQPNPIVAVDNPFSQYLDASMVWGSIYGRMLYAGLRFKLK